MFSPLLLLLVHSQKLNWGGPPVFRVSGKRTGHTYSVTFKQENFQVRGRELLWVVKDFDQRGHSEIQVHELKKASDWDGKYSSIYPGFRFKGELRQFLESDGSMYGEVVGKRVWDKVKGTTELVQVTAVIDGKSISAPRDLTWDLLNPNLGSGSVTTHLAPDGKSLVVSMYGSDGDGGYNAEWTLRKDGRCSRRFIDMP